MRSKSSALTTSQCSPIHLLHPSADASGIASHHLHHDCASHRFEQLLLCRSITSGRRCLWLHPSSSLKFLSSLPSWASIHTLESSWVGDRLPSSCLPHVAMLQCLDSTSVRFFLCYLTVYQLGLHLQNFEWTGSVVQCHSTCLAYMELFSVCI